MVTLLGLSMDRAIPLSVGSATSSSIAAIGTTSVDEYLCEELFQYVFSFLSAGMSSLFIFENMRDVYHEISLDSLALVAQVSQHWHSRVLHYMHSVFLLWRSNYSRIGGSPELVV